MLSTEISEKVLTIGCDYKPPRGGVAQVLNSYGTYLFRPFNFVATTKGGSKIKKLLWLFVAIPLFVFRCLSSKVKIVHVHGASYNSFYRKRIFINIAKILGKKVVYHIHGGGFSEFYRTHKKDVDRVMKRVDALVALSDSWQSFFEKEVGCKLVVVVPNIIPFPAEICKESSSIVECLFLGTINQAKGIYDLLDVIYMHHDEFRGRMMLHVGGAGEQDRMLDIINRYGLSDVVVYEGFVQGDHKNRLLSSANLFILPSYVEGLPISILEAMSYGVPILSTSVGGIPEIVDNGKNGILINPGDKNSLYQSLSRLIFDPELRKKMGEMACANVQPHLPDNVEKVLEKLYAKLL